MHTLQATALTTEHRDNPFPPSGTRNEKNHAPGRHKGTKDGLDYCGASTGSGSGAAFRFPFEEVRRTARCLQTCRCPENSCGVPEHPRGQHRTWAGGAHTAVTDSEKTVLRAHVCTNFTRFSTSVT